MSRVTQQLLCSKFHDFLAVFALAHSKIVVVFQSVSTENAYSAQKNVAICTIYSLFLEYFKV